MIPQFFQFVIQFNLELGRNTVDQPTSLCINVLPKQPAIGSDRDDELFNELLGCIRKFR